MKAVFKIFVVVFLAQATIVSSCSKSDGSSREAAIANLTSQLCSGIRGAKALYWDMSNGILRGDIPGGVPTIKNPGAYFIHSTYPALGFSMPQGYRAIELSDAATNTIGVNVLRDDGNVLWRYVTATFTGQTNAESVVKAEVNRMLANLGNPQFEILCSANKNPQLASGIITTVATRLIQAGNFTAQFAVNVNAFPDLGTSFVGIEMTMAPTAEYDAMVLDTFLPIGYQLLFIDRGTVQDSDGDGVPDDNDRFPFDPTRA